jgi:D-alanyl-D-alanine carboxypeptidase/D-alanyl-D-alanine-endopeptidase (penicillin-binding protein 4)
VLNVVRCCGFDGVRRLGSVLIRVHPANDLAPNRASYESENFADERARDGGKRSLAAKFFLLVALFIASLQPAIGQDDVASAALPSPLREALRSTGLPSSAFAIVVRPLGPGGLQLAFNDAVAMSPASTMKLVTTYAALDLLGPAFRWRTEAFTAGALHDETLEGDLVIRGGGDPKLVVENLWTLVQRIRAYGVREIRGDIVLDRSAFEPLAHDPALFDGEPLRPYNTGPDPLLLNFKTLTFGFVPDAEARSVRVIVTPPVAGLKWQSTLMGAEGPCNDWRAQLQADFADPLEPVFRGTYPLSCGERVWNVSVLDHATYFGAVFRALWENVQGTWSGRVRDGTVPLDARRIAVNYSAPLAEVIRDINKFSNNVMARQVFLALGSDGSGRPASTEQATKAISDWLGKRAIVMPGLVLENGSGLSRTERVTAAGLARLLVAAFDGPLMPEYIASLPLVNVDGLSRARSSAAGSAHIKSGSLVDVRAQAGYVRSVRGKRYVLVAFVNHRDAGSGQPFLDFILDWLYLNG